MVEASSPGITIIKFKRKRSCYVVPLCLDDNSNKTVSYFTHPLVHAINSSGGLNIEDSPIEQGERHGIQVTPEDIQLAFPKVKENPYSNEWVPIEDDSVIQAVILNDHDTIVFKHKEDPEYHLVQIEYQD